MMSLDDVYRKFPDNKACLVYIFRENYPSPLPCPKCKRIDSMHYNKAARNFVCTCGQYSIAPRQGTLFDQSRIPLDKWFLALYHIAHAKKGNTVEMLAKKVSIAVPSAHRLRKKVDTMILKHLKKRLDAEQIAQFAEKARQYYQTFPKKTEAMYSAEFAFREYYKKDDPFLVLLKLAITVEKKRK